MSATRRCCWISDAEDRNGSTTGYVDDPYGHPETITVTPRGAAAPTQSVAVSRMGGRFASLTQTAGSTSRKVSFGYSTNGHLASVTDTVGGVTQFASPYGTDTGQVVTVTNPAGGTTTLGFTGAQVTQVAQSNSSGAGTATTRLAYPSGSQTLVADPTTNQPGSTA